MKWSLTTCSSRRMMRFGIIGLLVSQWGQLDVYFFSRASVEPLKLFLVGFRVQAILADVPQPFLDRFAWNDKKRNIQEGGVEEHILANVWKEGKNPPLKILHDLGCIKHNTRVSENRGTPKSSIFSLGFPLFSPSILGYPYFWKHHIPSWNISPIQLLQILGICVPLEVGLPEGVQKLWLHHRPLQPWADQGLKQRKLASFRFVLGVELTKKNASWTASFF